MFAISPSAVSTSSSLEFSSRSLAFGRMDSQGVRSSTHTITVGVFGVWAEFVGDGHLHTTGVVTPHVYTLHEELDKLAPRSEGTGVIPLDLFDAAPECCKPRGCTLGGEPVLLAC